jgi:hypothetical protein
MPTSPKGVKIEPQWRDKKPASLYSALQLTLEKEKNDFRQKVVGRGLSEMNKLNAWRKMASHTLCRKIKPMYTYTNGIKRAAHYNVRTYI